MSIILDLAMGGAHPNGVCNCTTPASSTASGGTMSVAYVAAYSTSGSGGGGGGGSGTGPVTGYGGLCVDVRGANTANFTPVQVYTCNGTSAQQWTVVEAGSTLHALGKCMDINSGGTANGTTVDLYDCNGTAAQVFIPQSDGALYNPQSGKCLDDPNYSTAPGTQLDIWDCTGGANQQWNLPSSVDAVIAGLSAGRRRRARPRGVTYRGGGWVRVLRPAIQLSMHSAMAGRRALAGMTASTDPTATARRTE